LPSDQDKRSRQKNIGVLNLSEQQSKKKLQAQTPEYLAEWRGFWSVWLVNNFSDCLRKNVGIQV
jgi:hypothetical protein